MTFPTQPQRAVPSTADIWGTHSCRIGVAGDRAHKLTKSVDLRFLDFRSESAFHPARTNELGLDRQLYLDVYLDGACGLLLDHIVVNRRMSEALRHGRSRPWPAATVIDPSNPR